MSIHYVNHSKYPDSILVRDFNGSVDVQDIIASWEYLMEHKLITPSIKGVINRLMVCELNMDINSFETLMAYLKTNETLKKLKLAVICKDPKLIVFPMLGEYKEKELRIKPFTTETAAVNWIMDIDENNSLADNASSKHK